MGEPDPKGREADGPKGRKAEGPKDGVGLDPESEDDQRVDAGGNRAW